MKLSRQLTWCLVLVTLNNLAGLALILWNTHNLSELNSLVLRLRQLEAAAPAALATGYAGSSGLYSAGPNPDQTGPYCRTLSPEPSGSVPSWSVAAGPQRPGTAP
jgi:hypothetical protein